MIPVVVGGLVWLALLPWLVQPLRHREDGSRRSFLIRAGVVVVGAGVLASLGDFARSRTAAGRGGPAPAEAADHPPCRPPKRCWPWTAWPRGGRRTLTSTRSVPTIVPPAIDPKDWTLRIHGMVDHEITLTFQDLLDRQITEAWITLNCVSNEVGGDLIGNAWWSGVRTADLLAEAGVQAGADAVKQTSEDGWTCGTPLEALTDGRNAMLAIGMNGVPLPIEHGFPVRTIVPGLYGYVSATKWVVDLEVTKFADFSAYWTERGWSEQGPVKIASRIDVPRSNETGGSRHRDGRRIGVVAADRNRGSRGLAGRRALAGDDARRGAEQRHLGAVDDAPDGRQRRPRAAGPGDSTSGGRCRPAPSPTSCPMAPPDGTPSNSALSRSPLLLTGDVQAP